MINAKLRIELLFYNEGNNRELISKKEIKPFHIQFPVSIPLLASFYYQITIELFGTPSMIGQQYNVWLAVFDSFSLGINV